MIWFIVGVDKREINFRMGNFFAHMCLVSGLIIYHVRLKGDIMLTFPRPS